MLTESFYLKAAASLLSLFVVALPLANRDIFSLGVSRLFPSRLVLIILIGLSLVFLLARFLNTSGKVERLRGLWRVVKNDFLLKLLLALWLVRVISLKSSLNLSASFNLLLFYSSMIALYLVLKFLYGKQKPRLWFLFRRHLLVVGLIAVYGLAQLALSFFGVRLPGVLLGSTFVRIPATFYDSNHLPAYLLTAFPFLFVTLFYLKRESFKFFLGLLLSAFGTVTLFTFSRSGLLSFAVAIFVLTVSFLRRKSWHKLGLVVLSLFSVFIVIYLTSQTQFSLWKRLTSVFNVEDKSTVAHGLLWLGGLELFARSPLIGLGYGSFSEHFRQSSIGFQHSLFDPAVTVRIPAHSIWLEVLVETGILGFVLYLWLVITVLEAAWRARRLIKNTRLSLSHLALFSSFLGLLSGGIFYSYNLEFFWFFIFLLYFQSRSVLEKSESLTGESVDVRTDEPSESVPLKPLFFLGALMALVTSLILVGGSLVPVRPGEEGFLATVAKVMRVDWGYGVKDWWRPKFLGQVVTDPPLPFFANAFWTFLYDYGPGVVRFLPALAAFSAVVLYFLYQSLGRGLGFGFWSSILLLSAPGFLQQARSGTVYGYLVFFSVVIIFLSAQIVGRRRFYLWALLWPVLVGLSLTAYVGFLAVFLSLAFYFLVRRAKLGFWFLWLTAVLPMIGWFFALRSVLPNLSPVDFLQSDYHLSTNRMLPFYFLSLPVIITKVARFLASFVRPGLIVLTLIPWLILSFASSFSLPTDRVRFSGLILKRLDLSRDGRVPLYTTQKVLEDSYYYAEVPVVVANPEELRLKLNSAEAFYAIVEGNLLRSFREEAVSSFFVVGAGGDLVLIEKPGKVL